MGKKERFRVHVDYQESSGHFHYTFVGNRRGQEVAGWKYVIEDIDMEDVDRARMLLAYNSKKDTSKAMRKGIVPTLEQVKEVVSWFKGLPYKEQMAAIKAAKFVRKNEGVGSEI